MTVVRGHSTFPTGAGYSFDNNGNYTALGSQSLSWDHENHLSAISGGGLPTESYLYDAGGQRVRKTSNGVNTYYPNQYYEQSGSTITKYYYFNGQRVVMRTNAPGGWVHYDLHGDHLGSTVLMTNQGVTWQTGEIYYAYGRTRLGGIPYTDHKFTGQKLDATGLQYFNARYYDPELGQFLSPDTIVPDPGNLFDYNRYMFVRGNPIRYNDPTGHCAVLGDGSRDTENDGECWKLVDNIATGYWSGDPDWWNARFTSTDNFLNMLAGTPGFTAEYLNGQVNNYLERNGPAHYLHSQPELHQVSDQDQALEQFMKSSGLNKLKPAAAAVATLDCTTRDCVAIGIDTVGVIGGALKYGSVACGVGGPGAIATCAKIGGAVSNAATGAGAVWTGIQYARGNATTKDLEVAAATTFTGFAGDTGTSLRAGVVQWIWDTTISPFWNTLGK